MTRRWSALLVDAIDPVLTGTPFQAGQGGGAGPGASVIWCGAYDEVVATYPQLDRPGVEPEDGWCYDLTAVIDAEGRLSEVRLEVDDLPTLLAAAGRHDDAATAAALPGSPAEQAVPTLANLLARLLSLPED